jgi:hypothetical protein
VPCIRATLALCVNFTLKVLEQGAVKSLASIGIIAVILYLADTTEARAEMTANQLLAGRGISPEARFTAGFSLQMTALGLSWANADLAARKASPIYCRSSQSPQTPDELIEMLQRIIRDDPVLGDRPFGMALLMAFKRAFPCAPK